MRTRAAYPWFGCIIIAVIFSATLDIAATDFRIAIQATDSGQSGEAKYKIEIQSEAGETRHVAVTNLYAYPLTACFVGMYLSSEGPSREIRHLWDAYLQDQPPVLTNDSTSLPLSHGVGKPFPDTVEVAAAVWADGSTFGDLKWLKVIHANRTIQLRGYEWAVSLLQMGQKEDWTRARFLEELSRSENKEFLDSHAGREMKSNIEINPGMDEYPRLRRSVVQGLLDRFTKRRDALQQAIFDLPLPEG